MIRPALMEALGAVERAEAELLSWGIVDGAFTEEDLLETLQAEADRLGVSASADEFLDAMLEQRAVIPVPDRPDLYRTRMAETVRLLARLRQLFPKHSGSGWRSASRLVADFRLALRPRRYPTRDISIDQALNLIEADVVDLPASTSAAIRALLTSRAENFALSTFQVRATASILRGIESQEAGATVISAGTGSGKTLAFYLPVLANIASRGGGGPHAVAIYPRNELLKDQLSQTFIESRRLDGATQAGRKLTVGALFGATPHSADDEDRWFRQRGWTRAGEGLACPYIRCPRPGCSGPLVWPDADRKNKIERLTCSNRPCSTTITGAELPLTREGLRNAPPDVLFTTTEMLNRHLSTWEDEQLLGLGEDPPRVALIDEAHTYASVSGAQSALLLRRWHAAVGGKVHFVGLSATLADAASFFARLTGVPEDRVALIEPLDFEEEGMEYQLVLRGDPASGTQLLSTTIQAAMLLRRTLDVRSDPVSDGAYGSKAFVFTDDLEITNRLYHATRDAEGLGPYRQERRPGATPLAALRATDRPDTAARRQDGQTWDLAENLGHDLSGQTLLHVTRVSSQDAGVNDRSDLIVATASLEVGFNDPEVGGVIQHKAPRDEAAFTQRRGRAGRTRAMRPWTVVTLGDFGRDRLAYDAYDLLFDPILRPRPLPIGNRAVLRMQATYAWLDWTARRLAPSQNRSSAWRALAGPRSNSRQRTAIAALIEQTLSSPSVLADLRAHLRQALQLTDDQVESVLWEPPRALLTAVLPTALRRLQSDWFHPTRNGGGRDRDFRAKYDPLPDFIPANLFSELSLPEVLVTTPPQSANAEEETTAVPILLSLRTFAPGNVSMRFAVERRGARSWIPTPVGDDVPIDGFVTRGETLGHFAYEDDGKTREVRCVRPWEFRTEGVPMDVSDSSRGDLHWQSQIAGGASAHRVQVPSASPWQSLIETIDFHTHNRRGPVTVRRFAIGGNYATLHRDGSEEEGSYRFAEDDEPVGLGYEIEVDGLTIRPNMPERFAPTEADPEAVRTFRTALFSELLAADPRLNGIANAFKRQQLEHLYLSALVDRAITVNCSLEDAWEWLHAGNPMLVLQEAVNGIFATAIPASDSQDGAEDRRGADRLAALLHEPLVVDVLRDLAPVLWKPADYRWERSARARWLATLGAALASACGRLCPDFSEDEVVVDTGGGVQPDGSIEKTSIWVTERVLGGGGAIEEVHHRVTADPRRFLRLLDRTLDPSDFEVVDHEVPKALELIAAPGATRTAVARFRAAESHVERRLALDDFILALRAAGVDTRHAVVAALNARLLRPGTSAATDAALRDLAKDWLNAEKRLGIELETRVFAYACRQRDEVAAAIPEGGGGGDAGWRYGQILGLLWPHGWRVRAGSLSHYNPFKEITPTDAQMLRGFGADTIPRIDVTATDWWPAMADALAGKGICDLTCPRSNESAMADALTLLGTQAIDTGAYLLHPSVERIDRDAADLYVTVALETPT
jgi:DEAD/DEAH box helicase/Helicase conserved C-terminal domain